MNNNTSLISVCIVTYNHMHFIAPAIQSVLDQNYPNVEIIVADDASTDGTADIIRDFCTKYPTRIKAHLSLINQGISRNCNAGLKLCTGEYLCFLGGDDLFLPGKITAQFSWFQQHPEAALCGCGVEVFDSDSGRIMAVVRDKVLRQGGNVGRMIRQSCATPTSAFMFRMAKCGGITFDERTPIVSDWLFNIEACTRGKYGCVEGIYLRYRRHAGNITAYGSIRSHLEDRLVYTDIYLARYFRDYWSCRIQRGNILFQHGKRLGYDNQMRACGRAMVYSLLEWPFSPWPWMGLVWALFSLFGFNVWTKLRGWRHRSWRKRKNNANTSCTR